MTIVPFQAAHIDVLRIQPAQQPVDSAALAAPYGMAWTAMVYGEPVACAGVVEVWPGRGYAWALLSADCGKWLLPLHRAVKRGIVLCGLRRVEMAVDAEFWPGRRWAEMLGFELETPQPMRAYLPNGHDAYLYSRIQ